MKSEIKTDTNDLVARIEDGVGHIILNRPEARNAMSKAMNNALAQVLSNFEENDKVGAIILTGAGKGFCAGGDVKGMGSSDQLASKPTVEEVMQWQKDNQKTTAGKIYRMSKPVIAALPGAAAGAGMSLALACDFRIFAQRAFISSAFMKIGLASDYGGTYFLSKLVGMAKAKEIYYFSDRIGADECLALGIANWVVPDDELAQQAMHIARKLAHGPTVALGHIKQAIVRAYDEDSLDQCLDLEVEGHYQTRATLDFKEAVSAFVENRDAVFIGN